MAGQHDAAAQDGKIITVFSAKGGVGKTTFSTNLGAYLASTGARVLVVDLDLAFGDVGISLQMLPQNSIVDLVQMAGHIDAQGLQSIVTHHESGLDAACAPAEPSDADRIPGHTVGELLKVAKGSYDFIVVDTPPAFTEHVLAAFDNSDLLVLIATLDIPAVKNLRLTLDTLDLLGSPREDRVVVLNRSDAKVGLRSEDVVAVIKQEIAVMVPNSTAVPASVNRGVPIVLDEPKHPVSVAIRELAESFVRPVAGTAARAETKERRGSDDSTRRRILLRGAVDESCCNPTRDVRRGQQPAADPVSGVPERVRMIDPFAAVKASVHQALLDSLGPQLYDPHLDQGEGPRDQGEAHPAGGNRLRGDAPLAVRPNTDRPGGGRRDPRPRPARAPSP